MVVGREVACLEGEEEDPEWEGVLEEGHVKEVAPEGDLEREVAPVEVLAGEEALEGDLDSEGTFAVEGGVQEGVHVE